MRRVLLQLYRLAVLVAIAWIIRTHAVHLRVSGITPLSVEEVRAVLPDAAELRDDLIAGGLWAAPASPPP